MKSKTTEKEVVTNKKTPKAKNQTKYNGKNKTFYVKKKKVRLRKRVYAVFLLFPTVIFSIISYFLFVTSFTFGEPTNVINYNELGDVKYKVYLNENDYYDVEYIDEEMNLISNLISNVVIDFNYEIHSTEDLAYKYDYEIVAYLEIFDQQDKLIYDQEEVLQEETVESLIDNNFKVSPQAIIDYKTYDDYVAAFKKDYSLITTSQLTVTMNVNVEGTDNNTTEPIDNKYMMSIVIPLNEKTIEITNSNEILNNASSISSKVDPGITDLPFFILALISIAITLTFLALCIYVMAVTAKKKDIYTRTVNKYLREYDRIIITSKQPDLDENNYANKVRVMSIEELIDAHDITKKPIIYYEVIPKEKSYFVIIADDTLYKLTISKVYLENPENK